MSVIDGIKNVISGGRDLELKTITSQYEQVEKEYKKYFEIISGITKKIEYQSDIIQEYQEKSKILLNNVTVLTDKVFKQIKNNPKKYNSKELSFDIENLTLADDVKGLALGTLKGGTIALSSWTLVSVLGTASTGTAITTLSGVAGTNAILAWFGGGSLAVGGGGIALGTAVLGGIVLLPTAFMYTKYKNDKLDKKIQEYTNGMNELKKRIKEYKEIEPTLINSLKQIKEYKQILIDTYENTNKVYNELKPKERSLIQKIKNIFGFSIYSIEELNNINAIIQETLKLNKILITDFESYNKE